MTAMSLGREARRVTPVSFVPRRCLSERRDLRGGDNPSKAGASYLGNYFIEVQSACVDSLFTDYSWLRL